MKRFFLYSLIIITFFSCDPMDDRLTIVNKTNEDLYVVIQSFYNDSIVYNNKLVPVNEDDLNEGQILSHGIKKYPIMGNWDSKFINDTISIFVFDKKEIKNKKHYIINKKNVFMQRINVSHYYFTDNNWTLEIDSNYKEKFIKL